jgi:hypothetical protein
MEQPNKSIPKKARRKLTEPEKLACPKHRLLEKTGRMSSKELADLLASIP